MFFAFGDLVFFVMINGIHVFTRYQCFIITRQRQPRWLMQRFASWQYVSMLPAVTLTGTNDGSY